MSKIVLKSLSILLGSFFIFLGVLKITPKISRDLHKDLRTEYAKYAKVFPLAKFLDFKLPSKWYRRVVGGMEIVAGFLMVTFFWHSIFYIRIGHSILWIQVSNINHLSLYVLYFRWPQYLEARINLLEQDGWKMEQTYYYLGLKFSMCIRIGQ